MDWTYFTITSYKCSIQGRSGAFGGQLNNSNAYKQVEEGSAKMSEVQLNFKPLLCACSNGSHTRKIGSDQTRFGFLEPLFHDV